MIFNWSFKYLVIVGLPSFMWWLGVVDETALGLKPSDLGGLSAPLFIFYFLFGYFIFSLRIYLPYLIIAGAFATLLARWKLGRKWKWNTWLASLVLAGAVAALSLLTGVGSPLKLAIAAALVVVFFARVRGRRVSRWIDGFGKLEVIFLTATVMWLLPDWDLSRFDQNNQPSQSTAEIPPYLTRYERDMNASALDAIARFPDPQSCLVAGTETLQSPELPLIDWSGIRWTSEAEVCLFRMLSALGGIAASRPFLEAQGFSMPTKSFSPENPHVEASDDSLRITAYWSIRENGPKFPTRGVMDRIKSAIPYSMNINIFYSQDGSSVLAVRIGYNTL